MNNPFTVLKSDPQTQARRGVLTTPHGTVQTPIFMPVGTQGTVKALTPQMLNDVGAQIILGNTYHLNLRPGPDLVAKLGGLHRFMAWDKPILTDSGGFQVFSLAKIRKITDDGIRFKSHLDGREVVLDPAGVVRIQNALNSDIAMVLDECPPWPVTRDSCEEAVSRTLKWARECRDEALKLGYGEDGGKLLFGIVQGSHFQELRQSCAQSLIDIGFSAYAIGGVSVGEPEPEMMSAVASSTAVLPKDRARYVMGVGTPPQLLRMVALGADMFDCVMPTREARHGSVFTPWGKLNIKNSRFREDDRPLVEGLDNYTCRNFSRAYLRHIFTSGELLAHSLLSLHNIHFFLDLMAQARTHLEAGDYATWHKEWIARYESGVE